MTSLVLRKLVYQFTTNRLSTNFSKSSYLTSNILLPLSSSNNFNPQTNQVRYAGHSKWQNIKHTKGSKDQEKSILFARIARQVKDALKEGSVNPSANSKLAEALEVAKKHNVPKATVDKVIQRSMNMNKNAKRSFLEYRGVKGVCLLIELFTDNPRRAKNHCNGATKKNMLMLNLAQSNGSVKRLFEERGYVNCTPSGGLKGLTIDQAEEHAIEAGAEEVFITEEAVEFFTALEDFHRVKKELEESFNYAINDSSISFFPTDPVEIDEDMGEALFNVIAKIEDNEDIEKVYPNVL